MILALVKSFSKPFYQAHAGFFLLILFFGFGFLRSTEHIAIAQSIAQSDFLTSLMLLFFFIYHIQLVLFNRELLRKGEFQFLRSLVEIKPLSLLIILSIPQIILSAFPISYGLFVGKYIIEIASYWRVIIVLTYILLSIIIPSLFIILQIHQPLKEQKSNSFIRLVNRRFQKPPFTWYFIHLFKNRPFIYILTKALSSTLILVFFWIQEIELYDWRFLALCTILISSSHLILIEDYYQFQILKLAYFRNLPITISDRLSGYFLTVSLMLLPEILIILRKTPYSINFTFSLQIIFYLIASSLFYFHWILLKRLNIEEFSRVMFYAVIIQLIISLFGIPPIVLSLVMILFTLYIHFQYHYLKESSNS